MPRRVKVAVIVAICYGILWAITATWGVADVRSHMLDVMERSARPGSRRLAFDPVREDRSADLPWHFVGNVSSSLPFVVGVDWGEMVAPLCGTGGRTYFVWFFGIKLAVYDTYYWLS